MAIINPFLTGEEKHDVIVNLARDLNTLTQTYFRIMTNDGLAEGYAKYGCEVRGALVEAIYTAAREFVDVYEIAPQDK